MSFKFISGTSTGSTAGDQSAITELEVSGIFATQEKEVRFRLGNTGSSEAAFQVTASGLNSTINDDVEFSTDNGVTFSTTATVSGIQANAISNDIVCKYTAQEGDVLGVGSFLIRIDEE